MMLSLTCVSLTCVLPAEVKVYPKFDAFSHLSTTLESRYRKWLSPGAAEPRGPGGQLTPHFSGAGSTYGA